MSNLSELLPSGGGQNVVEFTADGAVASGKPVILNSDGTVTEVAETSISQTVGSPALFTSNASFEISTAFDSSSNKVIVAYQGPSNYGWAVVGTVSGTSISFGTPVAFESATANTISVVFDTNSNKVVIAYKDFSNSQYGTAIVGTVSGTSISFGSAVVFESAATEYISATFDSSENKVVIAYRDSPNADRGTAIVGTVSGTSISFGSAVVYNSTTTDHVAATFDSNSNKVVIAYRNVGAGSPFPGTAIVGTVSGTSISFGSATIFENANTQETRATFDSTNNKVILAYVDAGNSDKGTAVIGTVSGTSISFGTPVIFNNAISGQIGLTFDPNANKAVVAYRNGGNSNYGTLIVGTVSGTSISFGSAVVYENADSLNNAATFDSNSNKVVIAYRDNGNSNYGTSVVFQNASTETNLTATNFIGLAADAISDTASGDINVKGGINEAQTGLTIGSDYYVQTDGTLATTTDDPSVKVGKAITATTINMMDLT